MAKQAATPAFVWMDTRSLPYWPSFMRLPAQVVLAHPTHALSSADVILLPDIQFSKSMRQPVKKPSHCVGSERALFTRSFEKFFYFLQMPRYRLLCAAPFPGNLLLAEALEHEESQQFDVPCGQLFHNHNQALI